MSSYLDKCRKYPTAWLVYFYRGEIKVRHGNTDGLNFYPLDSRTWLTKCPIRTMEVSSRGKVLVWNKADIPRAKEMVYQHYLNKTDEVKDKALVALGNIKKMVESEVEA